MHHSRLTTVLVQCFFSHFIPPKLSYTCELQRSSHLSPLVGVSQRDLPKQLENAAQPCAECLIYPDSPKGLRSRPSYICRETFNQKEPLRACRFSAPYFANWKPHVSTSYTGQHLANIWQRGLSPRKLLSGTLQQQRFVLKIFYSADNGFSVLLQACSSTCVLRTATSNAFPSLERSITMLALFDYVAHDARVLGATCLMQDIF